MSAGVQCIGIYKECRYLMNTNVIWYKIANKVCYTDTPIPVLKTLNQLLVGKKSTDVLEIAISVVL